MEAVKREAVAAYVRAMIADGTLKPGAAVPSGGSLAEATGYHPVTCRRALRTLAKKGILVPGVSPNARFRVPSAGQDGARETPGVVLARALAARRHACGLTQHELAEKLGVSITTIGHAETGRMWQSRLFWLCTDRELGARGALVRLYDRYQAEAHGIPAAPENDSEEAPGEEAAEGDSGCSCGACAVSVVVRYCDGREVVMRP